MGLVSTGALRGRARASRQPPARPRPWLRNSAGPPGPGPHPPLHEVRAASCARSLVRSGPQRRGARAEAWRGRLIGLAERALALHCKRAHARVAFGQPLAKQGAVREDIAYSRLAIDQVILPSNSISVSVFVPVFVFM